jgi:phage terminase small subunit
MARIKELSHQEKLFIEEYLKDGNQTRAYAKAYPNHKTPTKDAGTKLRNPRIQKAIAERRKEIDEKRTEATRWERGDSVREYKEIIKINKSEYNESVKAKQEEIEILEARLEEDPDNKTIQESLLKVRRRKLVTHIYNDAILKALEGLNKMHGFNEQTINTNMPVVIFRGEEDLED